MRILLMSALAALLWAGHGENAAAADCTGAANAPAGTFCGAPSNASPDIYVYKGIRYGQAPAGPLRWMPPVPTPPATQQVDALQFQSVCPQMDPVSQTRIGDEDCLFLNVWTPKAALTDGVKRPVAVFIHGGAFVSGAGSLPGYDGTALAQAGDMIVATLNYRLGALGFLYADATPGAALIQTIPGNLGIMDQQTAMRWVKTNIAAFGGDPGMVTIFGESAGAMSVGLHHFDMPSSADLFRASIMESNPMSVIYRNRDDASKDGVKFIQRLCDAQNGKKAPTPKAAACAPSLSDLQNMSLDVVFEAAKKYSGGAIYRIAYDGFVEALPWTPVVDGDLVVGQPVQGYAPALAASPKPYMFGMNADEGIAFGGIACAEMAGPNASPDAAKECTPKSGVPSKLNGPFYTAALNRLFMNNPASKITGYVDSKGDQPYSAAAQRSSALPLGFNGTAKALADTITDQSFMCGNLQAAAAVAGQTSTQKSWGYYFARGGIFNAYWPLKTPVCAPDLNTQTPGQVCHGNELPYVFGTLQNAVAANQGIQPVPQVDQDLSQRMIAAWANFVRTNSQPQDWKPYSPDNGLWIWNADQTGMKTDLDKAANCSALWNGIQPRLKLGQKELGR